MLQDGRICAADGSTLTGPLVPWAAGACHAHNVGVSLLAALGMREGWVASSVDEYVALALAAAADVPKLAALRASLRGRMLASALCDAPAFVRSLEDTYRRGCMHSCIQGSGFMIRVSRASCLISVDSRQ